MLDNQKKMRGRVVSYVGEFLALPGAWVGLMCILVLGATLGGAQLAFGMVMLLASPVFRRSFLGVVRHLYPTRIGIVHIWFLLFVRRYWMRKKRPVQPCRVDLGSSGKETASVHVIPGLIDNYTYIIVERAEGQPLRCCVVDPGDGEATVNALTELREQHYAGKKPSGDELVLHSILVTHKHWDHQAGLSMVLKAEAETTKRISKKFGSDFVPEEIRVVAGNAEKGVRHCTHPVDPGFVERIGALKFEVVPSPCHTKGHVMFALLRDDDEQEDGEPNVAIVDALFTGDTLFCGGCGAPFEGSQQDMASNFRRIYHRCRDQVLLFPGHEYSEPLLLEYFGGSQPTPWPPHQFAALCHALQRARDCRSHHRPTVPVVLGQEMLYNAHFGSLHRAAGALADAWRIFEKVVNARALSNDAFNALRSSGNLPHALNNRNAKGDDERAKLLEYLEMSLKPPKRKNSRIALENAGAPPAADDDSGLEMPKVDEELMKRMVGRSKNRNQDAKTVRHRVTMRKKWRPGDHVVEMVSGVQVDVCVPEGVKPGQVFDVRIPREKLPPLLTIRPRDLLEVPVTTVWRRDLERMHSLLNAASAEKNNSHMVDRAVMLCRALLNAPLRDAQNYEDSDDGDFDTKDSSLVLRRPPRSLLPRGRYRGAPDEHAAQRFAEMSDDPTMQPVPWRSPPARNVNRIFGVVDPGKRRAPRSYADLLEPPNDLTSDDWRLQLRDARPVFEALCVLSSTADADVRNPSDVYDDDKNVYDDVEAPRNKVTIGRYELRRALAHLGPRTIDAASIEDLLSVADLAGCDVGEGLLDAKLLATTIATDFDLFSDDDDDDVPVVKPASCCRRLCCCCPRRRRRIPRRPPQPPHNVPTTGDPA